MSQRNQTKISEVSYSKDSKTIIVGSGVFGLSSAALNSTKTGYSGDINKFFRIYYENKNSVFSTCNWCFRYFGNHGTKKL